MVKVWNIQGYHDQVAKMYFVENQNLIFSDVVWMVWPSQLLILMIVSVVTLWGKCVPVHTIMCLLCILDRIGNFICLWRKIAESVKLLNIFFFKYYMEISFFLSKNAYFKLQFQVYKNFPRGGLVHVVNLPVFPCIICSAPSSCSDV